MWFQFDPGRLVVRFVVLGPVVRGGSTLVGRFGVRVSLGPGAGFVGGRFGVRVSLVRGAGFFARVVAGRIRSGRVLAGLRCGARG